jgi:hypothetical protein
MQNRCGRCGEERTLSATFQLLARRYTGLPIPAPSVIIINVSNLREKFSKGEVTCEMCLGDFCRHREQWNIDA